MSKLIDTLRESAKSAAEKRGSEPNDMQKTKTSYELTQEQLAEIYFSASDKHKAEPPLIIRVVEKPRWWAVFPWIVASLAFFIMSLSLFSTKRVMVNISVIDDKAVHQEQPERMDVSPSKTVKQDGLAQQKIYLDDVIFEGAAKLKSAKNKNVLVLVNSSVAPFARASIYFKTPIDLSGKKIAFTAKGVRGGEDVAVGLRDASNISAFEKGRTYVFPNKLSSDWQAAEVDPEKGVENFDVTRVTSLRFDFGSKDTENKSNDTIYIKDLEIVPA